MDVPSMTELSTHKLDDLGGKSTALYTYSPSLQIDKAAAESLVLFLRL